MDFDYFYNREAERFNFLKVPEILVDGEEFKGLSAEAIILYSMLLKRTGMSFKNNWIDKDGRVFMRWILKIILFPIRLLLSILTAFLTFLLGIGTTILYFLMLMCIVAAIGSFIQKDISLGIEALVLGFLLSPYGIPMVGVAVIAFLQGINEAIKSI